MSLENILFKPVIQKEFDSFGHKVVLKTLTTKDNMEMDFNAEKLDLTNSKNLLTFSINILSFSIVSIDGILPEGKEDTIKFLQNQAPEVVFDILDKYKSLTDNTEEIKN